MRLEQSTGVRYQTKQDLVYQTLREAIMHCTLAPGQRLVIEEIARELAVSPIPVREALHQLQSEGLVETVPHVGATVSAIAPNAVAEIFMLMEALELVAMRAAAEHRAGDAYTRLRALTAQMDVAIAAGDYVLWGDLNTGFHRAIARVAEMPLLQDLTDRVFDRWDRVRRFSFQHVLREPLQQAQREHHAMLDALDTRDHERLEQLVKDHNRNALATYRAAVPPAPDR